MVYNRNPVPGIRRRTTAYHGKWGAGVFNRAKDTVPPQASSFALMQRHAAGACGFSGRHLENVARIAFFLSTFMSLAVFAGELNVEEGFPSRPPTIIVPYAPGGGLDVSSRLVAKYAAPFLGQMIQVENITQGGNVRGYLRAIEATPDGYTIAAWTNGLVTDSLLVKKAPYTYRDVRALCMFANDPHIIAVGREFAEEAGINELEDLLEYARLHPGVVSMGVGGNWTTHDLLRRKIERIAKVKFNRIPFLGGAPALQAVAKGNCHVATPFVSELLASQDRDRILPLVVAYHERVPQLPALASVPEVGYPGMTQSIWRVFALPKETPIPVMRTLESAFRQAIENPDFIEEARALGVNPLFMGMDKIDGFLEKEYKFYFNRTKDWEARNQAAVDVSKSQSE